MVACVLRSFAVALLVLGAATGAESQWLKLALPDQAGAIRTARRI